MNNATRFCYYSSRSRGIPSCIPGVDYLRRHYYTTAHKKASCCQQHICAQSSHNAHSSIKQGALHIPNLPIRATKQPQQTLGSLKRGLVQRTSLGLCGYARRTWSRRVSHACVHTLRPALRRLCFFDFSVAVFLFSFCNVMLVAWRWGNYVDAWCSS